MPITNPAQLPEAFLFFTIKLLDNGGFAIVAYGESVTEGTKLKELQGRYLSRGGASLPYMEKFAPPPTDGTLVWQSQNLVSYDKHISQEADDLISLVEEPAQNAAGVETTCMYKKQGT
ncbi:MAG: hypothetical protein M1813_001630 [Trichoglossum hirsutum]|nr:MAG: hypothetical protein M1813_001630 [Trichoglossum hirsutum]